MLSIRAKFFVSIAIFLWASGFVAIRASLVDYSPEGLALLRYLIASAFMSIIYWRSTKRSALSKRDTCGLLLIGMVGVGIYNITLNYGELTISSGMASFITSQAPIITVIFAIIFLNETLNFSKIIGFMISILGVALISAGEFGGLQATSGLFYILIAMVTAGCYSVLQKPFLKKCDAIQATAYIIWGGTLFLVIYFPHLIHDLYFASFKSTLMVAYLGLFPATIGYIAWSYALAEMPASQAASFLYFMPPLATLLGWFFLAEIPMTISLIGGACTLVGVWLVNYSYKPAIR